MGYNTTTATVGVLGFNGKVLAVSGDGSLLLVSDPIANATYLYSTSLASRVATAVGGATAGALTPDNQWSLSVIGQNLVRQGNNVPIATTALSYTPNNIDVLAQGSLAFITSSTGHSVDVRPAIKATCKL